MFLAPALTLLPFLLSPAPPQESAAPEDVTARIAELIADDHAEGRTTATVDSGTLIPLGHGGDALIVARATSTTITLEAASGIERTADGRTLFRDAAAGAPIEGPRLMSAPMRAKGKSGREGAGGSNSLEAWTLPEADHPAFQEERPLVLRDPGNDPQARARMAVGYGTTSTGEVARLEARALPAGGWELTVEWGAGPRGIILPRPDAAAVVATADGGDVLTLRLDPVPELPPELEGAVQWAIEGERTFGGAHWDTLGVLESADGTLSVPRPTPAALETDDPGSALLRTRVRAQVRGGERLSAPGPAAVAIVSGQSVDQLLGLGLSALVATDFERRLTAHALLLELGDRARPSLVQLEDEGSPAQAEAAALVLDAIDGRDGGGAPSARRLQSRALATERPRFRTREEALHWLGDVPLPLLARDPLARAAGLLTLVDRAESGLHADGTAAAGAVQDQCDRALAWVRALATTESDEAVRALAGVLLEVAARPSSPSFDGEGPAWLRGGPARVRAPITASMADLPERAEELLWTLEARPELADLDLGLALARVTSVLAGVGQDPSAAGDPPSDALYDYDVPTIRLALELVERAADMTPAEPGGSAPSPRTQILGAVRALLPGAALDLAAWRHVSDRRGAAPSAAAFERGLVDGVGGTRQRVTLGAATLDDLREAIDGARGVESGVDILLPPGTYPGAGDERRADFVDLRDLRRVRLLPVEPGGEPVVIGAGLRLFNSTDIVIRGIEVNAGAGQGLSLMDGSHGVLVGARIVSSTKAVYMADSVLEVRDSTLTADDEGRESGRILAQLIGRSRLIARTSSLLGGSLYIGQGTGSAWLDRCVIDSGRRPVVQGQRGAILYMRESLARSRGVGLMTVEDGLVVASVIDTAQSPLGRGAATGLRVSPRLLRLVQPGQRVPPGMALDVEPLPTR